MFLCNWKVQFQEKTAILNEKLALFNETPKLVWVLSKFQWNSLQVLQYQKSFSSWRCQPSSVLKKEIRSSLWTRRKVYWYFGNMFTNSLLPCQHWHGCWIALSLSNGSSFCATSNSHSAVPNNHVTSMNVEIFTQNNYFGGKELRNLLELLRNISSCQYGIFKTNHKNPKP